MTVSAGPAIVVQGHNRPAALARLLDSVDRADVAAGTPLIISIDTGAANESDVLTAAERFVWRHGPTSIVTHHRIGLVGHFEACGDLTASHGQIIVLEDDLIVARDFHRFATAALTAAADDTRIAGISLATPFFDGYRSLPFEPISDGGDAIYAQIPWYDGMAWTPDMWTRFSNAPVDPAVPLHESFDRLDTDEWFPQAVRYLVQHDRYFMLARHAQCTNTGLAGTHFDQTTDWFQVALALQGPSEYRFRSLDDALGVYDDHLELIPAAVCRIAPTFCERDFTVDLLAVRDLDRSTAPMVLTTRPVQRAVQSWGSALHPLIANVAFDQPGDDIHLAALSDVDRSASGAAHAAKVLHRHATRGQRRGGRAALADLVAAVNDRTRRGR